MTDPVHSETAGISAQAAEVLTERARVVAIDDDCLWVETERRSTCGSCAARKGCGNSLLAGIGGSRRHYVRVLTGDFRANQFTLDDEVDIAIPESVLLRGAMLVYLMPLLCLFALAIAADHWFAATAAAPLGAFVGFLLGLALVRWHAWSHRQDPHLQPVVVRRLGRGVNAVFASA